MRRIKIHPVFLLLLAALAITGRIFEAILSIAAVLLHEYAHYRAALSRCYRLNTLTLMPYGAVLYGEESMKPRDEFFIAAAGPVTNLAVAVFIVALWWLFPSTYLYTLTFFKVNVIIALFNLLPAYPLDGARMILSKSKNRIKTLTFLRNAGLILSGIFAVLFIISAFGQLNLNMAVIAVVLAVSAFSGTRNEKYIYLCSCLSCVENYERPVEIKRIAVAENTILKKIVTEQRPYVMLEADVVDKSGKIIKKLASTELENAFMTYPLDTKVGDYIKNSVLPPQ